MITLSQNLLGPISQLLHNIDVMGDFLGTLLTFYYSVIFFCWQCTSRKRNVVLWLTLRWNNHFRSKKFAWTVIEIAAFFMNFQKTHSSTLTQTSGWFYTGGVALFNWVKTTALLKVDFGSRSQSRVPDFYPTFVKKSTLKSTLLDFKSGKSDLDSTPPRRSTPSPKP